MRYEDLPAALQRQIRAGKATVRSPNTKRRERSHMELRCFACKRTATSEADAQRHAHDERHLRIECVI